MTEKQNKPGKANRILLIGWDGADWQHITPLLDEGLLPGLESLINRGVMGNLATLQPVLSPMLWNSIATGKTADKHGIHGFVEPMPDNSGVRPSTSTSRKSKAIWNILNQNGWRSNVVGWWASFPAERINGNVVTNLFNAVKRDDHGNAVVGPHVIHPQSRAQELADYKVDITEITENDIGPFCPNYMKVDQDKDRKLVTLAKLLSDCASIQSVTTTLMADQCWDFTAVYFDSIDHFCHAFMPYHPPRMPNISETDFELYKDVIRGAYQLSDMMLQRLIHLAGEDTTIVLCSDHGFQSGSGRPLVTPLEPAGPALWHRNHGIVVMAGPGIKQDERIYGANIIDITPTLLYAAGLPIGKDMDGRVLLDAFEDAKQPETIESWENVSGDDGQHPDGFDVFDRSSEKQDDLIKQFVALGYIEDPGDNREQAAINASIEQQYNLARVLYTTNRFDDALPIFEKLVQEVPWEDRFWKNLAYCYYELKLYQPAEQIIQKLYQDADRLPPFSELILAQCTWENGDVVSAYRHIDSLLGKTHRVANVYASLGQLLVSRVRDLEKAEAAFEKCRLIDPDFALAHEGLAGIYFRTGRHEQCIEAALKAVTMLFRLPKAHLYLGLALEKTGDLDNAIVAYEHVNNFRHGKFQILANKRLRRIYRKRNQVDLEDQAEIRIAELRRLQKKGGNTVECSLDLSTMPDATERKKIAESRRNNKKKTATVEPSGKSFLLVSGLPRSGTSLMMQMLHAGGIELQTDGLRGADENNPAGYYEWEAIKQLHTQPEILDEEGVDARATKVISMLLPSLPAKHKYKVIFMTRPISQIAASQAKMIDRLDTEGPEQSREEMERRLHQHREKILHMIDASDRFDVIHVEYESLLNDTKNQIQRVVEFLGDDRLNAATMPTVIRHELHREKSHADLNAI